ncbi:MAG TPA: hypothetical protein VKP64_13110 [Mycobacteriales bacterium]|nr:hypothetical protein [Mycobacteriales bacterium]
MRAAIAPAAPGSVLTTWTVTPSCMPCRSAPRSSSAERRSAPPAGSVSRTRYSAQATHARTAPSGPDATFTRATCPGRGAHGSS